MLKRIDTGSPWPLGNNPAGEYYTAPAEATWISNSKYPLWKVVRASTAAPSYFDPEKITIATEPGREPEVGHFIDGGVSPFNNPALQAFMYATLEGYRVGWKTGADNLLLISIGTGTADPSRRPAKLAATASVRALLGLMDDCGALVKTMMQWMSTSPTAIPIDSEIGDLARDLVASTTLFTYQRYDLDLTRAGIEPLGLPLSHRTIFSLSAMDKPENLDTLRELGIRAAARRQTISLMTSTLLRNHLGIVGKRRKYLKKADSFVVAVRLDLVTEGFTYEKWGGTQVCKAGDWLVNNASDIYTVDGEIFARTYRSLSLGIYEKITPVWAEVAERDGHIETKEGVTHFKAGAYIVYNNPTGGDGYAVEGDVFEKMYEPAPLA